MSSLRRRTALAVGVSAALTGVVAAAVASVVAAVSLRAAEDRRLRDAAVVLAIELDRDFVRDEQPLLTQIVADEAVEMQHTGIVFAVAANALHAGDARLHVPDVDGCDDVDDAALRRCRVTSPRGFAVVAADAHGATGLIFLLAALAAALVAVVVGVVGGKPIAAIVTAPLSRLRERVAAVRAHAPRDAVLGDDDDIVEVDAIRATITALLAQTADALDHARRFAADAAHELRTPLATISAELELLAEAERPAHDDIVRVQRLNARLQVLVERLLILATPQGASLDDVVDVADVVDDLVAALPAIDRDRIVVDVAGTIRGDAVLLATMIDNGLRNALQHAPHVTIGARVDGTGVVVIIADDGPGIVAAEREIVFQPFVRTSDGRRRRRDGHGLGLALVAHIAQLHGGRASFVDSTRGAQLEVTLPRAQ